jgi:hypothetical protein
VTAAEELPGTVHLTLTGPHAGTAGCAAVRYALPAWGSVPLPDGHRGVHYAYAPASMIDGSDPRVCRDCLAAFDDADSTTDTEEN